MARYIDADTFKAIINEHCKTQSDKAQAYWFGVLIDMQPTADVAPIADTVRKMQERLKTAFRGTLSWDIMDIQRILDQIAKEMLEGEK